MDGSIHLSIPQTTNQSINGSIHRSIAGSINQPINRPLVQPIKVPITSALRLLYFVRSWPPFNQRLPVKTAAKQKGGRHCSSSSTRKYQSWSTPTIITAAARDKTEQDKSNLGDYPILSAALTGGAPAQRALPLRVLAFSRARTRASDT